MTLVRGQGKEFSLMVSKYQFIAENTEDETGCFGCRKGFLEFESIHLQNLAKRT